MRSRGALAAAVVIACAPGPAVAEAAESVPGQVIVRFESGVGGTEAKESLAEAGAETARRLPLAGLRLAEVTDPEADAGEAIAELERDPAVAYAEPNLIRRLDAVPDDPFLDDLWGFENAADSDIDATAGWDVVTGTGDLEVAVVDDGIARTHPDLAANMWANPGESGDLAGNGVDDDGNGYVDDPRGWDFADNDANPAPVGADGGHGTHVAGSVGAVGDNGVGVTGVAWQTKLMALRVFDSAGNTTTAKIVAAFRYATQAGAEVVNGSFGGGGFSQAELDAIRAGAPRTLFVVAAGNDASDNDAFANYPCRYDAANLLCVAATDSDDELASFSNYGATSVDLAAPGVDVLSTYPQSLTPSGYLPYAYMSGTSMATPITSGAAALVYAEIADPTAAEVARRLRSTVDPVPALAGKVATGGRLNLAAAITGEAPPAPAAPEPEPPPATTTVSPVVPPLEPPPDTEPPPAPEEPAPVPVDEPDAEPPQTRITAGPRARSRDRTPKFRFASSEPGSGFRCTVDERRPRPCASPYEPGRIRRGRHVFAVTAVDEAGNRDASPATKRFRIARPRR